MTAIKEKLRQAESALDDDSLAMARQLSALICNTLSALWDIEEIRHCVNAKINFEPITGGYAPVAEKYGFTLLRVASEDEFITSQIPQNMILLMPKEAAPAILKVVALHRKNHLRILTQTELDEV